MSEVINIYKPQGMTPLQLIELLRKKFPAYQDEKIGFAGRLDPLAHGVMLLTVGEANKTREPYLNLNKTYKFSVLFGVESDTYDYLGYLKSDQVLEIPTHIDAKIGQFIQEHTGILEQLYPPFSSKTLNGVPLFKLAKRKKLRLEDLPVRTVEIFDFNLLSIEEVPASKIFQEIMMNLKKIKGYFRQTKIIRQWEKFFEGSQDLQFKLAHFEVECSSGTYVRSLAHKLGQELGCGAIAFEIFRTKVGDFNIDQALRIDSVK